MSNVGRTHKVSKIRGIFGMSNISGTLRVSQIEGTLKVSQIWIGQSGCQRFKRHLRYQRLEGLGVTNWRRCLVTRILTRNWTK